MTDTTVRAVPEPTLRRLPSYLHLLKLLRLRGREVVSTTHIAEELHLDPTQVRRDLGYTGAVGRPKVGFRVDEVVEAIERFLGLRNASDAFLVGAGHLGTALLGYATLRDHGLNIVAAFDTDPAKVGATVHGREVLHLDRLVDLARRIHVHIGILTVPATAAQDVAERMEEGGLRAIWNFTPHHLQLGDDIAVVEEDLHASLAVLLRKLEDTLRRDVHAQGPPV